jgi:hypothetical protein
MTVHTLLRAIHILAGSLWVGAAVLNAVFLIPAVMASGPAGGQVMRVMAQVRRLPVFMNSIMALTLLSGLWLYWRDSGGFRVEWVTSRTGLGFTAGALLAIATAAIGATVSVPAVKRLGQLVQRRLLRGAQVGSTLLVLATLLMATARFL